MFIKKLSQETINLISAGEVIEGPSDILKELLENSVDAKATEIVVEIKSSGLDLIKIKDDGTGILKEDLEICLEKYTTSKLEKIDDLYSIDSFGFRGEALSTIAAVSKFKIVSSTTNDGKGYLLENNNISQVSSNKGTTITVQDLFYNVPVRKKFLKSKSFEYSKLYEVFLANALLNPNITFKFISEKKNIIFPKTDFENRLVQIYGSEIKTKTINLNIDTELFKVKGILTNPQNPVYFPSNFLFINKRFVFSPQIYKAIIDSYKDYLMIQQKPFFILFIELDPRTIDVNVHPKKRVVKLQNEMLFLSEFKRELSNKLDASLGKFAPALEHNSLKDFISSKPSNNSSFEKPVQYNYSNNNFSSNREVPFFRSDLQKPLYENNNSFNNTDNLTLFEHNITKILGQIKNTFIICETDKGMILIDQHAADERINLEKNRLKYSDYVEKQNLISEISLDFISESHKEILNNNIEIFKKIGFEYYLKNEVYFLKTIPLFLNKYFDKNLFLNLLKDIEEGNNEVLKLKDSLLKLRSCKESIKANDYLSIHEQIELIKKLNLCKDKGICAHGRPTIIFLSIKDLEILFKRIV
ncbi:MAG: DNA mismatch repair endonuclease MutL [Candidatus ainarchaeum sp.]|nr:DNA mismatch repair endonuclease MutL [Candidatus ainarchaeum sp.]